MFGPDGTPTEGAEPRLGAMNAQSSDAPSATHSHGEPLTAFNCAGVTAFATPVAVSPIQSSMPVSRCCVNANRLPSAEKPIHASFGFCGSDTFFSAPSAIVFNVM